MLINRAAHPQDSIYYIACCVLSELKKNEYHDIDELLKKIKVSYNQDLDYTTLMLAIDFLYLINKVDIQDSKLLCI